jgi:glycosyltransferase involved in cell wall biosynthesis
LTANKVKAAFIDHSFHKITRSSDFIKNILCETFDLVYYYDESWGGGTEINIEELKKNNYEYIFYWQRIHTPKKLKKLKNSKIIFFPMEDSTLGFINSNWLKYASIPIKIVCFSKNLFNKLKKLKVNCFYAQYYINTNMTDAINDFSSKRVYFWNRTEEINWKLIKKLLGNNQIDNLIFMAVSDPNFKLILPDKNDLNKYNIKIFDIFLEEKEYNELVSKSNIYISPRKYEGIGLSFLEALTRGQCVIAPNYMTMNEYIEDGVNGYLYELTNEIELDLRNFESIGREARKRCIKGYEIWEKQKNDMIKYILRYDNLTKNMKLILFFKTKCFQIQEFLFK